MVSAAPPPEVAEADARGRIAELYADIRGTAGLPMVNMLYRRLAVEPACLEWVWATVRPALAAGTADATAAALRSDIDPQGLPDLPETDDPATVAAIVEGYNRANPKNVVLMAACAAARDGITTAAAELPPAAVPPPLPDLPAMIPPEAMDPQARDAVARLTAHRTGTPSVPSIYRHLARWPGLLAALADGAAPLLADGTVAARVAALRARADGLGPALAAPSGPPPEGAAGALLDDILAHFPGNMSEMAVIGVMAAVALPQQG